MIYLILPMGNYHGWGVCGKYLTRELSLMTETKVIAYPPKGGDAIDPLDYNLYNSKIVGIEEFQKYKEGINRLDSPALQAMFGPLLPWEITHKDNFKAGYTFFEDNLLTEDYAVNARKHFDIVITGSKWCEDVLRQNGISNVKTIIQGVDPQIFNPYSNDKKYFQDKFVIFSGGKFELRKGQDLVIRAFKILQDKYKDVMLITSWFNMWPKSFSTMKGSRFIILNSSEGDFFTILNKIMTDNGIDLNNVINLPPAPNTSMARVYKNTDIGLFPNRCEGGTNLVLMEYMACGKPVIASYNSGHKDILTKENSIMLERMIPQKINDGTRDVAIWESPGLDEIVSNLEWAYNNRDKIRETGNNAGQYMSNITWQRSAEEFYKVFEPFI